MAIERVDPIGAFRFRVVIDGKGELPRMVLGCTECTGLSSETETKEYSEGGYYGHAHRFRGPLKFPLLVLKRGFSTNWQLWAWHDLAVVGRTIRSSGSIELLGASGQDAVMTWEFKDAFPVKWSGPDLRAETAGIAFESIELAHRGLTWKSE